MHSCCSIDAECALSPVEQARTLTSLHPPSSLDDFMLPNHGISSGNQLFTKLLSTTSIFAHAHTQPSHHHTCTPLCNCPRHPNTSLWRCYTHCWNGCVGLC